MPSAITPIATITTTSTVNSIVFSSISQAYRDLKIVFRGNMTSGGYQLGVSLPSGLWHRTYASARLTGDPEVGGTNSSLLYGNYSSSTGNELMEINVFDYAQTDKFKSFTAYWVLDNGTVATMSISVGSHALTTALTSLTVSAPGIQLSSGFSVSIYGVSL